MPTNCWIAVQHVRRVVHRRASRSLNHRSAMIGKATRSLEARVRRPPQIVRLACRDSPTWIKQIAKIAAMAGPLTLLHPMPPPVPPHPQALNSPNKGTSGPTPGLSGLQPLGSDLFLPATFESESVSSLSLAPLELSIDRVQPSESEVRTDALVKPRPWTPVPEPNGTPILTVGLVTLIAARTRRRGSRGDLRSVGRPR